ncbi:MAG: hypothetical protein CMI29_08315 [Opitutae bacterium]|nr:hypothetical protein [Opitutae bacterium]|tara:strand:- start:11520 stop:12761 length:1242 start_codon:yes stop_codon:yes gene_type:complete
MKFVRNSAATRLPQLESAVDKVFADDVLQSSFAATGDLAFSDDEGEDPLATKREREDDASPPPADLVFDREALRGVDRLMEGLSTESPTKQAASVVVRRVTILPQPEDALKPLDVWSATLDSLGAFVLSDTEVFTVTSLAARMHNLLQLPSERELSYNEVLTFFGHYLAMAILAINVAGPPNVTWGGPLVNLKKYPAKRCADIHAELIRKGRVEIAREALARVCSGTPLHPFYAHNGSRKSTNPYMDTMGGIVEMIVEEPAPMAGHPGFDRELLIATTRGAFMGHIFVTYARAPLEGMKGLMPYGISRSAFYLPGTCAPPQRTSGFIQMLFETIDAIMREKGITHAFTWPLAKMKERFVAMNWLVIPKGHDHTSEYAALYKVVGSIYGIGSRLFNVILGSQFRKWDFVMRVVA